MSETMSGRTRFLRALRRESVDRVPIFETVIHPSVEQAIVAGGSSADFADSLGLDCVMTSTPSSLYAQEVVGGEGDRLLIRTEWGEVRAKTKELVAVPVDHPVKSHADWERYRIPDADAPDRLSQLQALVSRFHGEKAVGVHLHDAFNYPTYILGMANLFTLMYEDPTWVREIVDATVEHNVQMVRSAARLGADFVMLGDDYGGRTGPLMSPRHFEEFFLPGFTRVVQTAKEAGLCVLKHTDGQVEPILGQMVTAGIDAFHPSDPTAGMDIVKVKAAYGDQIAVAGGIDCGEPLQQWSASELVAEVRRRIRQLAPGGGWLIASSNAVFSGTRPENYLALVWATRAYGRYDSLDRRASVDDLEERFGITISEDGEFSSLLSSS
jgi:uroporphyrinogen decarboxylase